MQKETLDGFELKRCGFCRGELLWDQESGESVCCSCGAVSTGPSESISEITQLLGITNGPSRSGQSAVAEAVGVTTIIGGRDVDGKGRRIGQSRDLRQLRRLDTMVSWNSERRRLGKVSMEVRRVAQALGLSPLITERAFEIYLKQFNAKSLKARSLTAVAAASLLAACRELDIARPSNEVVAERAGVNRKQLRRYYQALVTEEQSREVPDPVNYVSTIAAKVSLKGQTERLAVEMITKAKGNPKLVGKRPMSIAAAALYLASVKQGDNATQLRLAYAAGVTPITIRKRSVELSEIIDPQA